MYTRHPETVLKYQNFLNAFQEGKKFDPSKVMKRFKVSRAACTLGRELGLLKTDGEGYTVAAQSTFTEEHANKLLDRISSYNQEKNRAHNHKVRQPREGTAKEKAAINLLKALGYKIMKPVNEFVEV